MVQINDTLREFRAIAKSKIISLENTTSKTDQNKIRNNIFLSINHLKDEFEYSLSEVLLPKNEEEKNNILGSINMEIEHIIKLFQSTKDPIGNELIKIFEDFMNYFNTKYHFGNNTDDRSKTQRGNWRKINWIGNLNTLSTFFLQLKSSKNTIGRPLMQCDDKDLRDFMVNNFLYMGKPISVQTANTYFDTKKQVEKMAKKEVIEFNENEIELAQEVIPSTSKRGNKNKSQEPYAVSHQYKSVD